MPTTTFACNHAGPPYPIPPVFHNPSNPWPPSHLPNHLCYSCSIREVTDSINQHDAKIAAWNLSVEDLERRLQRKAYLHPLPIRQQIRERKREIETENKRWLAGLKNSREQWRSVWGGAMPRDLAFQCDERLMDVRLARLGI